MKYNIIGIDVGLYYIGFCCWDIRKKFISSEGEKYFPYAEVTSLQVTADGRAYIDYKEKHADEMAYNYIQDRWAKYFKNCKLCIIEKQLSYNKSSLERGCIIVESCLKSILRSYQIPYICKTPHWWKRICNIPLGNHQQGITRKQQHGVNKKRDIKKFKQLWGENKFNELKSVWGGKMDDLCDSVLICYAGVKDIDKLLDEIKITSNHTHYVYNEKKRINVEDRKLPLLNFHKDKIIIASELPAKDRIKYLDLIRQERKVKRKKRKRK